MIIELLTNIWAVYLDTAFWLLVGLLAAGLIRTFISQATMKRWVGGRGLASIMRAALFGAPLPLCSCGVLPAAIGLRRSGASKEATVSFLISTPETSIDSVAVTYALMGPLMAIVRPLAALVNAIGTGLLTTLVDEPQAVTGKDENKAANCSASGTSGCSSEQSAEQDTCCSKPEESRATSCCGDEVSASSACCAPDDTPSDSKPKGAYGRMMQVMHYAGAELLDDISKWLAFGIVLAGVMLTFIPPNWLAQWGGGLSAMLIMLVVGVPMYICAVASTPVAAGLLLAGVSPGAVLVFLLVGPATNIASFALVKQELGLKVTVVYLLGLSCFSLLMGLSLEWFLAAQQLTIEAKIGHAHSMLPEVVSWGSAIILLVLGIRPVRRALLPMLG
jgi:uncharacterized membrane protein YraQ (UPF0718 family)